MAITTLLIKKFTIFFPLITIVGIGYFYDRRINTDMTMISKINIDIFIPALIFSVISKKTSICNIYPC